MLAITARLFDENGKLAGYAVTDGQQTKQLSRLDTWNYAKQKMIMNVTASGDVNDPVISGTNGFELKKLPEIRANKAEAKPFTTQTLDAIILRNLISGKIKTIESTKVLHEQAKQQLKEEITSGKLDRNKLGGLSESIFVKHVLKYKGVTGGSLEMRNIKQIVPELKQSLIKDRQRIEQDTRENGIVLMQEISENSKKVIKSLINALTVTSTTENKENTKESINKLLDDTTAVSKEEALVSLDVIIKFVDEMEKYINSNDTSFKTMNSLQPAAPVIGYQIEYRGQEPINTYRISPLTKQLEPFIIQPNTIINLNRAEMAILSSLPEIGCTFRNGKVVSSSKRITGDLYTVLSSCYFSFNEGGIAGKEITVQQVEKPEIIEKYFQRGDERLQAKTGMTITKQILDMLKIKNALSNKSIDVNEQSVKDAIASGQLDISKINKQSENITVVRTLTDANSNTAITQIIGYQILYNGTEPIETYRVSPIDKQLIPFVINTSDKVCLNRMEMAILASKEEVGCKFSNGILTKSSKGNQVNELHAWLNSWYFALNDSHGATVYDMALPIQSVETPETIRKYFLTTGERTAQQKQAINNATGLKGLMGAFKR